MPSAIRARLLLSAVLTAALTFAPALGGLAAAETRSDRAATAGNGSAPDERPGQGRSQRPADPDVNEDSDTNDDGTPDDVVDDGDNAHPSGRDRSVEPGGSGNQGKAAADPDDDGNGPDNTNGGADQPDGNGGVDLADQDGNNGCGNDDDFEDDNEGRCGGRAITPPADVVAVDEHSDVDTGMDETNRDGEDANDESDRAGEDANSESVRPVVTVPATNDNPTDHMSVRVAEVSAGTHAAGAPSAEAAPQPAALAATGARSATLLVLTALSLLLGAALLGLPKLIAAPIRRR